MLVGEYTAMVKLTCVSVMALKHYLLEFNWYRAITQCTWHSYSCGQTVGWIKIPLGKEIGLGPGHIMLAGDPVGAQPPTAAPPHFRLMPIVAKRSPISATAELLLMTSLPPIHLAVHRNRDCVCFAIIIFNTT